MLTSKFISSKLAEIIANGVWTEAEIESRIRRLLGERRKWVVRFTAQLHGEFASKRPQKWQIERFLREDSDFQKAIRKNNWRINLTDQTKPVMRPVAGPPTAWNIQPILHRGELADWLALNIGELNHLADCSYRERQFQSERPRNYRYHWLAKRSGNSSRLIEVPKPKLKRAQRQILYEILDGIPAHPAAHGFCQGRSTISCVAPHVGQEAVLRIDLRDFFPTIRPARVLAIFRTTGYPEDVARLLTALCTNVASIDVWDQHPPTESINKIWRQRRLYDTAHLPQGAPTSPALGNLVAYRLDLRLDGLAKRLGIQYTRYADDLIFSGRRTSVGNPELGGVPRNNRLSKLICTIAADEGFEVNIRKTRIMFPGTRQHACGLTLNKHVNVSRREFDKLKAILHNCVRLGPASQNSASVLHFRDHLLGRVVYVESVNSARGKKLRSIFDQIDWAR